MKNSLEDWQYPIGKFEPKDQFTQADIIRAIEVLEHFPIQLEETLEPCSERDLHQPYRPQGWTLNQLVHHLADSHMHAYLRCKFAFLEKTPTILPYNEQAWAESCPDTTIQNIAYSLTLIKGLHKRWTAFFKGLNQEDFLLSYRHPERETPFSLGEVACFYAWHASHHLAHIKQYLIHLKQ